MRSDKMSDESSSRRRKHVECDGRGITSPRTQIASQLPHMIMVGVIVAEVAVYRIKCHLAIATLRAPDATSPRQCHTKNALIAPSSRSKVIIFRARSYAPSFRGFRLA